LANERREVGFMILTIEPCPVPSVKGGFQVKFQNTSTGAGLKTHAPNNLSVGGTWLVFQEEITLKQRETRRNSEKSFTEVDRNNDLKNRVGIEVN
jgi:hypothetical protein